MQRRWDPMDSGHARPSPLVPRRRVALEPDRAPLENACLRPADRGIIRRKVQAGPVGSEYSNAAERPRFSMMEIEDKRNRMGAALGLVAGLVDPELLPWMVSAQARSASAAPNDVFNA